MGKFKRVIAKMIKITFGAAAENSVWLFRKVGGTALVNSNISYAQCGEDIIICYLMRILKKKSYSYLDIGANDPKLLNNTYLMYKAGNRGVLIEPNMNVCERLKKVRKGDKILNCGVAGQKGKLTYYLMDDDTLNTFSMEEAEKYVKYGSKMVGQKEIEVITINEIMKKYGKVDFLSIDVEGKDFEILKTLDFEKFSPLVICMETNEYCGTKREDFGEIKEFLERKGFMIYADTMINTIYVEKMAYLGSLANI